MYIICIEVVETYKMYNGSSVIYDKGIFDFTMLSSYLALWPGSCYKLIYFKRPCNCPFLKYFCPLKVIKRAEGLTKWLLHRILDKK